MLSALLPEFVVLPQLYLCKGVVACNKAELSNTTMGVLRSGEIASSGLHATGCSCSNSHPAVSVSERSDGQTSWQTYIFNQLTTEREREILQAFADLVPESCLCQDYVMIH